MTSRAAAQNLVPPKVGLIRDAVGKVFGGFRHLPGGRLRSWGTAAVGLALSETRPNLPPGAACLLRMDQPDHRGRCVLETDPDRCNPAVCRRRCSLPLGEGGTPA